MKKYKKNIVFDKKIYENYVKVKTLDGSSKSLLHSVGWIDINSLEISSQSKQIQYQINGFKEIYKAILNNISEE